MFRSLGHFPPREGKWMNDEVLRGMLSFLGGIIVMGLLVLLINLSG